MEIQSLSELQILSHSCSEISADHEAISRVNRILPETRNNGITEIT
jgi:hypothetical protein